MCTAAILFYANYKVKTQNSAWEPGSSHSACLNYVKDWFPTFTPKCTLMITGGLFSEIRLDCPSAQSDQAILGGGRFLRKATAETHAPILTQNTSKDAVPRKGVPFGGRETNI